MAKVTGKTMRVLITGGSGLIGRGPAANLARDGNGAIIPSLWLGRIIGLPTGVSIRWWDGRTIKECGSVVDNTDVIINFAGDNIISGRWTSERKRPVPERHLNAGKAAVQGSEAAVHKSRAIIQASGIGYYGPCGDGGIT